MALLDLYLSHNYLFYPYNFFMRFIFILFLFTSFVNHPHHEGVIEIEYNSSKKELQIAGKWFVDDLEEALRKKYKYKKDLIQNAKNLSEDSLVVDYFKKNLIFKQNNIHLKMDCVGTEHENSYLWVYFVIRDFDPNTDFYCYTQVLCDLLKDQSHIIHILKSGKKDSFKSSCVNSVIKYKW